MIVIHLHLPFGSPYCSFYFIRLKDLPDDKVTQLSQLLNTMKIETELKKDQNNNIANLISMGCYRGLRHKSGLPVNGSRTRTNARTAKKLNGKFFKHQ